MIDSKTIQALRKIVVETGRDNICKNPNTFAGTVLDICDANEVKLLTTVLRSHYSVKLMSYFRDGSADAVTWTQQKTFLINESGMSVENAERVLDVLWQIMGWQLPATTLQKAKQVKKVPPEVEQQYINEYGDANQTEVVAGEKAQSDLMRNPESEETMKSQKQKNGPIWLPWMITAIYFFLFFEYNKIEHINRLERIKNGDFWSLIYLVAPLIAVLLVCARGIPNLLRVLGAFVISIVTFCSFSLFVELLGFYAPNFWLIGEFSIINLLVWIVLIIVIVLLSITAGVSCYEIGN